MPAAQSRPATGPFLAFEGGVLCYWAVLAGRQRVLKVDFAAAERRLRRVSRSEPLIRACVSKGAGRPVVLDATAGMGGDAMTLAQFGCQVIATERDPVVYALLADGLRRARDVPWLAAAAERVRLYRGDVREHLAGLPHIDIAYADPMFEHPGRGQSRLAMQLLGTLARPSNGGALVARLRSAFPRTVVKRRRRGRTLGGQPAWHIEGRAMRFDVYAP